MNQYRSDEVGAARTRSGPGRVRLASWVAAVRASRGQRVRDLIALSVGVVGGYAISNWAASE
jgi:hypothetical protein